MSNIKNDLEMNGWERIDILDVLLDDENKEPICLVGDDGRAINFEQVAVIPHEKNGKIEIFAVLAPIDKIEGMEDNEAIVFRVDTNEEGESVLAIEEDEPLALVVFDKYLNLLKGVQMEEEKKPDVLEMLLKEWENEE